MLWYFHGSLKTRNYLYSAGFKMFSHAFEGMCVYEKGNYAFASRNCTLFSSSVACVELIQKSLLSKTSE